MKPNRKLAMPMFYIMLGVVLLSLLLLWMTGQWFFIWISVAAVVIWLVLDHIFDRCPHCGKALDFRVKLKYCPHCGKKIEE